VTPLQLLDLGIATIPLFYRTKHPEVCWGRYQHTLPSRDLVKTGFRPRRLVNVGILTGWQGLVVVDFDSVEAYLQWSLRVRIPAPTYTVRSSRGVHVYFFLPAAIPSARFTGGDIKSLGGLVLAPPSVHPTGAQYLELTDRPIARVESLEDVLPRELRPAPQHVNATFTAPVDGLWPLSLVERICQAVPIITYFPDARASGSDGRWLIATCPWHDDRQPSLRIDTLCRVCSCFAGCTPKAYNVINVHARLNGLTNAEAICALAKVAAYNDGMMG
jgi:hypothetical protein